eukprot:1159741-Pelagomonas_calceolata.AAC.17
MQEETDYCCKSSQHSNIQQPLSLESVLLPINIYLHEYAEWAATCKHARQIGSATRRLITPELCMRCHSVRGSKSYRVRRPPLKHKQPALLVQVTQHTHTKARTSPYIPRSKLGRSLHPSEGKVGIGSIPPGGIRVRQEQRMKAQQRKHRSALFNSHEHYLTPYTTSRCTESNFSCPRQERWPA